MTIVTCSSRLAKVAERASSTPSPPGTQSLGVLLELDDEECIVIEGSDGITYRITACCNRCDTARLDAAAAAFSTA